MKLLVDTHLLLWAALQPNRLPAIARTLMSDLENQPYFSAMSIWELAIKHDLGRADFQIDPALFHRGRLDNEHAELPITSRHHHQPATHPLRPVRPYASRRSRHR